ncbi:MAG: DUF6577 family protein [Candidatus Micrarchaeota archaeon]
MTNAFFGNDATRIARLISKDMPAVTFVVWDLTPFIPHMHNWRKNIVFVECDKAAVDTLAEKLAVVYPNHDIYAGAKKPKIRISRGDAEASIVITAREGKERREVNGTHPKIEKCLVDLLYYSRNELLPISLKDVLGLWEYYLTDMNSGEMHFSELYRYSLRRYLGWFVSIFAYELSRKNSRLGMPKAIRDKNMPLARKIDGRHLAQGMKNLELIRMADKLE